MHFFLPLSHVDNGSCIMLRNQWEVGDSHCQASVSVPRNSWQPFQGAMRMSWPCWLWCFLLTRPSGRGGYLCMVAMVWKKVINELVDPPFGWVRQEDSESGEVALFVWACWFGVAPPELLSCCHPGGHGGLTWVHVCCHGSWAGHSVWLRRLSRRSLEPSMLPSSLVGQAECTITCLGSYLPVHNGSLWVLKTASSLLVQRDKGLPCHQPRGLSIPRWFSLKST
jgi:hypothetical protein